MNILIAHIHDRPHARLPFDEDVQRYLKLASRWADCASRGFRNESDLAAYLKSQQRHPSVVLCDMRASGITSEVFAGWLKERRGAGTGQIAVAIGPADGWSDTMLNRADLRLSFGAMTMPHALARLVLAEQIYRATTILTGHPYHLGH